MKHPTRGRTLRVLSLIATAAALVLGTVAAPANAATTAPDGMATAWVRAAHLVPGLGSMSISLVPFAGTAAGDVTKMGLPEAMDVNGAKVIEPASAYGTAGEYRQVPQGLYTVMVRPQGASADTPPLLTGTVDAKADQAYTLAALGTKAQPRVQVLSDDLRPPKAGTASVRLLPAATAADEVTVTAQGGPTLAQDAAFGRPTGYAAVPAGPWTLDVAGTGGTAMKATSATGQVDLASGGVYTVLVLDGTDGGVVLKPVVDAQGVAQAPVKGVQTGAGGTATQVAGSGPVTAGSAALVGGVALLLLALTSLRRRHRTAPARVR